MKKLVIILGIISFVAFTSKQATAQTTKNIDPSNLKQVTEKLVPPPGVPIYKQVDKGAPVVIHVKLVVKEMKKEIAPGVTTWALTFDGSVPAPLIVGHVGDYIQLHLVNPITNTMVHNIDFHAATGGLGSGKFTHVAPGQDVTIRFKLTYPGVFIYHCAPGGIMVPLHVVSGMNGAIMVLPKDGLKDAKGNSIHYNKAYYIGEQDYYIPKDKNGNYKTYKTPAEGFPDMLKVMRTLTPTFDVYNGSFGALTGKNALTAKVGDKVLFIHSEANRSVSVHLIGGHADLVWRGGSFGDVPATNLETWFVPAGSATAALTTFHQPGTYLYLNHNLIDAMLLGASATVKVEGKWNNNLMQLIKKAAPIKK